MLQQLRSRLTYANVISTLCLFLLLGGGTAVALNGSNTVQSDDLGPGAQVKAPDVADNAVNSSDVVNNGLTGGDIRNLSLGTAEFSRSIPTAHVTRSGDQTIPNSLPVTLAFNSERGDSADMHSNTLDNDRLTAPVTGIYRVSAQVGWDSNSTGTRALGLTKFGQNGSAIVAQNVVSAAAGIPSQEVSTERAFVAGDYVIARVTQTSGGPLDVLAANAWTPEMTMTWVAPGR
jgi:hypothetical protein